MTEFARFLHLVVAEAYDMASLDDYDQDAAMQAEDSYIDCEYPSSAILEAADAAGSHRR